MTSLSTLARAARLGAARKRGVTLIEAVLYISIALALIVGGLVFFQQASLAQRTNSAVRNISAIASETRGLYQQQNSFSGLTTGALINAGAVPTSLVTVSGTTSSLTNEWGGTITVEPNLALTSPTLAAGAGFTVIYPSLSIAFRAPGGSWGSEVLPGSLDPDDVSGSSLCGQTGGVADVRFTFLR
ncbi:MAG: hypothetical protein LW715_08410 [Rhodobacter sp.]|nr:hypothetical protein [Rhodobacter sp.]